MFFGDFGEYIFRVFGSDVEGIGYDSGVVEF